MALAGSTGQQRPSSGFAAYPDSAMGSAAEPDPAVDSTDPVPIAEELVDSMDPAQLAAQTQQAGSTGHPSVRQAEAPAGSTGQRMPLGQQNPQPGHPRSRK